MSYNSHRPLSTYSVLEVLSCSSRSMLYYGTYAAIYAFWFLPRSWLIRSPVSPDARKHFEPYVDRYYARPEFAFYKAEEGRCFRDRVGGLPSPSVEIGYEDGRLSSYHTAGHVFDIGLEYDTALAGKPPLFPHYRQIVAGSFAEMPFAPAAIGSIVAIHVLDHVAELDAALAETARVLKPGGQFLFSLFSHRAPAVAGSRAIALHDLHNFLDRPAWQEQIARHGLQLSVYREFTFSPLCLRLYFLGMRRLIPHDRSFLLGVLQQKAPFLARGLKAVLKHITYAVYWPAFNAPPAERSGGNVFIAAQKSHPPGEN